MNTTIDTPTVADLLQRLKPHVEWLKFEQGDFWVYRYNRWAHVHRPGDTRIDEDRILGAIYADIEARGWDAKIYLSKDSYEAWVSHHSMRSYTGRSKESICHAALLALIKALGAEGENLRCEACLGTGKQDHFGYGTFPCSDCHGTGTTAREVQQ